MIIRKEKRENDFSFFYNIIKKMGIYILGGNKTNQVSTKKEVIFMGKTMNKLLNIILIQWIIIVFLVVYLVLN